MKKIYISIFFAATSMMFSQTNETKSADYLFKRYEFTKAADQYLKLTKDNKADSYVYKQLADCYYYTSKNSEAETWYAKALESSSDKEALFRYALVLKANGKLADYKLQMDKFKKNNPSDIRAIEYSNNPDFVNQKTREKFTIKKLDINSDNSDFGAFLNNGTLYFASARNLGNRKYGWNNEPFLDVYKSTMSDSNTFSVPTAVSEVNSSYHDGPSTVTADGKTMYFSTESFRQNKYENDKKDKLKLSKNNIYKATLTDGKWTNIVPLNLNSVDYSTSNPCISRDGSVLYFSSNRPGGVGGVDIWKAAINSDGTVGQPVNLGDKINTEANESFPFINDDNTKLYFSSNGRNGYGAYDVYEIDLSKNTEAKNLGKPVNTASDDFAFSYYDAKKIGFLSSNRDGNDDIYMTQSVCERQLNTIVKNEKTGEIIANANVTLLDKNNAVISTEKSDSTGAVNFNLDCNQPYSLLVAKENFEKKSAPIEADNTPTKKTEVLLTPSDVIITDREVLLNPIYFELNKWDITPQGAKELDKLVKVMMEYPNMVIFAKSHTDNRGSDASNLSLSDKRAKSTVAYVISQGIDASRISGKGFGESELKVKCDKCTEEQHSQNRRSEFLIVKK